MSNYKHILLAADFSDHGAVVANKAKELADQFSANLSVVHVMDNIVTADINFEPSIVYDFDLTVELRAAAKKRLDKLAETLHIKHEHVYLETGSPKLEIVRMAEEHEVDLIVVGSHGRHGLALLLGSTANGVLHHAKCDVLAVRLQDKN